jgi:acetoin utilization deacetylase AcuC-like enzyme
VAYPFYGGLLDGKHTTNVPLGLQTDFGSYRKALESALARVPAADYLVVSYGTDCLRSDPVGGMRLDPEDFRGIGEIIGGLGLPVLAILEGGYDRSGLVAATREFREGIASGQGRAPRSGQEKE